MKSKALLLFLFLIGTFSFGQETPESDTTNQLKVFLDCNCDQQFIKQELNYLHYVRDRLVADVQVQLVHEPNGSGAGRYTIYFIGLGEFKGNNDTLILNTDINQTNDEIRHEQLNYIKIGLASYMVKKGLISQLQLSCEVPTVNAEVEEDKWRNWVVEISANGWFNGEEQYHNLNSYGSVDINKIKEEWKFLSSFGFNYNESKYFIDPEWISSVRRSQYGNMRFVKSLNNHWSAGINVEGSASIFDNYKIKADVYPGLEYNVFDYNESTKHILRFVYTVGARHNEYIDTTVYGHLQETRYRQSLGMAMKFQEKWGSVSSSASFYHYFHDININSLSLWTSVNLRLFKGLSWNISGWVEFVRDQISLPQNQLSQEDILLRQKQLKTAFRYWGSMGISYTFGSIYNNIVNPRFGY